MIVAASAAAARRLCRLEVLVREMTLLTAELAGLAGSPGQLGEVEARRARRLAEQTARSAERMACLSVDLGQVQLRGEIAAPAGPPARRSAQHRIDSAL